MSILLHSCSSLGMTYSHLMLPCLSWEPRCYPFAVKNPGPYLVRHFETSLSFHRCYVAGNHSILEIEYGGYLQCV